MKNYTGRSSSPLEKIWIFLHASGYISLKFFPSSLVSSQHHTLYIDKLWPAALKNIISTYLLSPESNIVEGLFKTDHGKPILMLHFFVLCFQNSKYWKSSMLFKVSYDFKALCCWRKTMHSVLNVFHSGVAALPFLLLFVITDLLPGLY